MTDKKEYNDTSKNKEGTTDVHDLVKSHKKICCFEARPVVQFASSTVLAVCKDCNTTAPTKVESSWSIKSYLCCYYCHCCWFFDQLLSGKDFIIKDANHKCSNCDGQIAKYESC